MKTPQDIQQALGVPILGDIVSTKLISKAKKGLPVTRQLYSQNSEALNSAIACLVNSPGLCTRFGQASRQMAEERFDMTIISEQTRKVYEQFISNFSGWNL